MEYEELFVLNEFSEIIKYHNSSLERLKRFEEAYPYLIAPNVYDMLQHNLRDNITILFREMSGLKDQKNKQYDQKYVCKVCNKVYMLSLPNGLCDECRGKNALKSPELSSGIVNGKYGSNALSTGNGVKNGKTAESAPPEDKGSGTGEPGVEKQSAPPSE